MTLEHRTKSGTLASARVHINAFKNNRRRCVICGCEWPDDLASARWPGGDWSYFSIHVACFETAMEQQTSGDKK